MLDEKRVILMTSMAAYEDGEGKENMAIGKYFRGDYMGIQIFKAIACGTISFLLIAAIYIYYNLDEFMEEMYELDFVEILKGIGVKYVWFLVIYVIISYLIATARYARSRKNLRKYYKSLKKLEKIYKSEEA